MRHALEISLKGQGYVYPNPLVGAVIVRDGHIISEGYHERFGGAHAEINALRNCDSNGGTMYVTLEPCSHYGKTPPCVDAIIKSGIIKVVCAMEDPNPIESGAGFKKLMDSGIIVINGILEKEAKTINAEYINFLSIKK
jgi:diaminohydroxyphosphoribosylaminopyrimidine deaminase/5-amino-6-(5-phosphoribosylamino)uracil reductase